MILHPARRRHVDLATRLRNLDLVVQGSAFSGSVFFVTALAFAASGFAAVGSLYAWAAWISALVLLVAHRFRAADGIRLDAELERAVAASLAEGDEPALAEAA